MSGDRLALEPCGCRSDRVTGLITHFCAEHEISQFNVTPAPELRRDRIVCAYRLSPDCIEVIQEGAPGALKTDGCCTHCLPLAVAKAKETGVRIRRQLDELERYVDSLSTRRRTAGGCHRERPTHTRTVDSGRGR